MSGDAHVAADPHGDGGVFRPPWRTPRVPDVLRPLLVQHQMIHHDADLAMLQRAYETARHIGRTSGEPVRGHVVVRSRPNRSTVGVTVQIEALDLPSVTADIPRALADGAAGVSSVRRTTTREGVAIIRFGCEPVDAQHLDRLLSAVRAVAGVSDAYRVTAGS